MYEIFSEYKISQNKLLQKIERERGGLAHAQSVFVTVFFIHIIYIFHHS